MSKVICDNTYLLEQIMIDHRPGYVPVEGDVSVFRVGAERGPGHTQGIRGNGTQRLREHWLIPDLHPPTCGISPSPLNEQRYTSPPKVSYVPSPPSYVSPPETLSPSYSTSSPASSASPPTTAGMRSSRPRLSQRRHCQATRSRQSTSSRQQAKTKCSHSHRLVCGSPYSTLIYI